ncbi:hypothetical protein FQN50_007838 [Emmonsiellopsis sp. PD_5]|nr:hypothetical protein FQN50_007838 [Emmonsiellopsis sp. PD_5]
MSTKKPRPRLSPESAPWISTSKRYHAALQDKDLVPCPDSLFQTQTWPFKNDIPPCVEENGQTAQSWSPEISPSENFWHAVTIEIPQPSRPVNYNDKTEPQQNFFRSYIAGKIPNFSRPFQTRPDVRDMAQTSELGGQVAREAPKLRRVNGPLFWIPPKSETLIRDPIRVGISCGSRDGLQSSDVNPHILVQPAEQAPVETLRPPGSLPSLDPPPELPIKVPLYSDTSKNEKPPTPDPPLEPPPSTSPARPMKPDALVQSSPHEISLNDIETPPGASRPHSKNVKQKARKAMSSLSSSVKNMLRSFPRGKKGRRAVVDIPNVSETDLDTGQKYLLETSHTSGERSNISPVSSTRASCQSEPRHYTAKTCTSALSNISSSYDKPRLPLNISTTPLVDLEPFQCTFCLLQCSDKIDWLGHEQSFHLEDLKKFNSPYDPNPEQKRDEATTTPAVLSRSKNRYVLRKTPRQSCSTIPKQPQSDVSSATFSSGPPNGPHHQTLYWNCGFCKQILRTWDERQEHLADEHFSKGETMCLWDPLTSPFPWQPDSAQPANAPPFWDARSLLALQQPNLLESINEIMDNHQPNKASERSKKKDEFRLCKKCNIPHPSLDHYDLWHESQDTYACPGITPSTNLANFFEEYNEDESTVDICRACSWYLDRPTYLDRSVRERHLRREHKFSSRPCEGWGKCFSEQRFQLHLADVHHVDFECMLKFSESLRKHGPAVIGMLQ